MELNTQTVELPEFSKWLINEINTYQSKRDGYIEESEQFATYDLMVRQLRKVADKYIQTETLTEHQMKERDEKAWIKVEDGLPEERPGWSNSLDVNILLFKDGNYWVSTGSYSYQLKKWCEYLYNNEHNDFIIAWQPLPAPPIQSIT